MSTYILSEKALKDLNSIWIYTAENWSVEQANRYYNLILDEIEYISAHFETAKDFSAFRKDYRFSKVKSHLLFFKKSKQNTIEVVRILDEKMDIEKRLII